MGFPPFQPLGDSVFDVLFFLFDVHVLQTHVGSAVIVIGIVYIVEEG